MKKLLFLFLVTSAFVSCSHEFGNYGDQIDPTTLKDKDPNEVTKEDVQANVANIFGTIDPAQDWKTTTGGTVSITADADMDDIAKVQVLTEAPFYNTNAEILAEAIVTKGQSVTLTFEAPNGYTRLIAACVDSKGQYYVKGFNIGTASIRFSETAKARTRGEGDDFGFLSNVKLPIEFSSPTFNAIRTIKANEGEVGTSNNSWERIGLWKNAGWENEREWRITPNAAATNGTWSLHEIANKGNAFEKIDGIRKALSGGISTEEQEQLNDIFANILRPNYGNNLQYSQNNLIETIMKSDIFNLENNNLTSSGKPLTIIPVQKYSSETNNSELYYYYFNPTWVAGKSSDETAQFIKSLPKFKALKCSETGNSSDRETFFRDYEYLLPYYGDAPLIDMETLSDYQSDGKLYRIKNSYQVDNEDYYFCYQTSLPQARVLSRTEMESSNAAGEGYWLWKIYKNAEGKCYLYNVGARTFFYFNPEKESNYCSWTLKLTPDNYLMPDAMPFQLKELGDGWYNIMRTDAGNTGRGLGTDLNKYVNDRNNNNNRGVWADKNSPELIKWFFEEYTGDRQSEIEANAPTELKKAKTDYVAAKSAAIPEGYKVGFMIRKAMGYENTWKNHYYEWIKDGFANQTPYTHKQNGDLFGDSRLNKEINQFGDLYSPIRKNLISTYNYPRIAMFTANGKSYLNFEDGADLNFNDFIVEVNDGVQKITDDYGVGYIAYTMCFEDRPIADYDLNDAVLQFTRLSPSEVQVTLMACGAYDELYLRGLNGQKLNETTEIHKIFGIDNPATFINTDGSVNIDPVSEVFAIDPSERLSDFLETIYIYDATTDQDIKLSGLGDSPHAIVVPTDFKYPKEKQCITWAYPLFQNWVHNAEADRFWFRNVVEEFTYHKK